MALMSLTGSLANSIDPDDKSRIVVLYQCLHRLYNSTGKLQLSCTLLHLLIRHTGNISYQ